VDEMIKQYDMGVVTYEQTEYMNLAMPTKAGEYALTGLPFIISDMISVRSVFSENSVCYVTPENSSEIAEKVAELRKDGKKRQEMAQSSFNDMLRISWNVMKTRYLDLILKLTSNK
jgi:glycosyltransferase involved in cell wall biosynthesis